MSETVTWVSDADGTYVLSVNNATIATGSCVAGVDVVNTVPFTDFVVGANTVVVTVTNADGSGFDTIVISDGSAAAGLCWASPLEEQLPREEQWADPLANRLSRHMVQPRRAQNVFILQSGTIVNDWTDADDPIRVALFGADVGQHVSQADADLLASAGYAQNLVACVSAGSSGWDTGGWDTTGWDS